MSPTINKYDLVRYVNTPFHEIQVNDIIFYSDNDKIWIHKVTRIDYNTQTILAKSEVSDTIHRVTEDQYIGKSDSIIEGAGYYTIILDPKVFVIILIVVFVIPIAVMRIRERRRLKAENS